MCVRQCVRACVRVGVAGTDQEGESIITCSLSRSYFPYKSLGFMLCVGERGEGGGTDEYSYYIRPSCEQALFINCKQVIHLGNNYFNSYISKWNRL